MRYDFDFGVKIHRVPDNDIFFSLSLLSQMHARLFHFTFSRTINTELRSNEYIAKLFISLISITKCGC